MHHFRVTVNGRMYDVSVEELGENNGQTFQPSVQSAPVVEPDSTQPSASPADMPPVTISAGDKPIVAPLSGTIIDLKVKPGEQVEYGQVLLTLEALKMENEIVAPEAGTVRTLFVKSGSVVNVGDVLLSLS